MSSCADESLTRMSLTVAQRHSCHIRLIERSSDGTRVHAGNEAASGLRRRPEPASGRLTPQVAMFRSASLVAMLFLLAPVVRPSVSLAASPQSPTGVPPVSLERIREQLKETPAPKLLDVPLQLPVATFKTGVDQRMYGLTLEEQLRKEFTLTPLQRQSAEWASKCCGLNLNQLFNSAERALHCRKLRKIRQQIARELAQLEAARKK